MNSDNITCLNVEYVDSELKCSKCNKKRPLAQIYRKGHRPSNLPNHKLGWCKFCTQDYIECPKCYIVRPRHMILSQNGTCFRCLNNFSLISKIRHILYDSNICFDISGLIFEYIDTDEYYKNHNKSNGKYDYIKRIPSKLFDINEQYYNIEEYKIFNKGQELIKQIDELIIKLADNYL